MESIELLVGEKQKSESYKAIQACNDFLRMGPGRTITALFREYQKTPENASPTSSLPTLNHWAQAYGWQARAEAYDVQLETRKNARAAEIMGTGLALSHERVDKLKELAAFLEGQLYEQGPDGAYHNVWVPDVKQIGSGQFAEQVDIERFNAALIDQYRGTLDDLAKETGGRAQKQEITGANGGPVILQVVEEIVDANSNGAVTPDPKGV